MLEFGYHLVTVILIHNILYQQKIIYPIPAFSISSSNGFKKILNSIGLIISPCGTPRVISKISDNPIGVASFAHLFLNNLNRTHFLYLDDLSIFQQNILAFLLGH